MPHYNDTVASSLTATALFDYMADFSNAEQWDPGTRSAKRLDRGKIGEGSRFELIVEFAGRESPFVYEITGFDRPNQVVIEADTDAAHLVDTMSVAKSGLGSDLTYDARLELKGWRKLGNPVMAVLFRRLGERGKEGLERELNPGGRAQGGS
jgi:Polyketide cyclase / dehydrase and lipid transport